ncbi:MAG: hypothetical protein AB1696_21920 [Planctomycetota bacterium]
MNRRHATQGEVRLFALMLILSTVGCGALRRTPPPPPPPDYALKGQVIQRLKTFDNPESAIFSADGKYVFISNAVELGNPKKGFHFVEHGGFISKLEVQPDGTLKMVNPKLLDGMTGPLGLAVLPKATNLLPAGAIFVCKGNLPMAEPNGTRITDAARLNSELIIFDADGKPIGAIGWGTHSLLAKISGAPATQPNGMAFDKDGNLYVAETGMGGDTLAPRLKTAPGVMMIPHGSLDDLVSEKEPKEKPRFIPIPGGPDGVAVSPTDQAIHVNTVGLAAGVKDPDKGATFRLQKGDFVAGVCPKPIASGFGALDGLTFLPNGTRLETQVLYEPHYILVTPPGGDPMRVPLEPDVKFTSCADIAVQQMADGSYLLVIPQLSPLAPSGMKDEVTVVKLPKEFGILPPKKEEPKKEEAEKKPVPVKQEPEKPKVETKAAPVKEEAKEAKPEAKAVPAKEEPKAEKPEKKEKKPFSFFFGDEDKKKREDRTKKAEDKKPFLFFFGKPSEEKAAPAEPKPEATPAKPESGAAQPSPDEAKPSSESKKGSVLRETKPMEIKPRVEDAKPVQPGPIPAAPSKVAPKPEEDKPQGGQK